MWCSLAHPVSFLHPSLSLLPLCLLKSGPQLSPFSISLFHPPSLSHCEWESGTQLRPVPSLSLSLTLSCTLAIPRSLELSLQLLWLQEKSVKGAAAEIFIDLFSSVLFISLSSLVPSFPLHADPETPRAPWGVRGAENQQHETIIYCLWHPAVYPCKQSKSSACGMEVNAKTTATGQMRRGLSSERGGWLFIVFWQRHALLGGPDRKHEVLLFVSAKKIAVVHNCSHGKNVFSNYNYKGNSIKTRLNGFTDESEVISV